MGRRDQINIMATLSLKGYHHLCQGFAGYCFSGSALADIIILAVFTGKIAVSKKNSAGSMTPGKRGLFSKVRTKT
jgi:hypothetical protein